MLSFVLRRGTYISVTILEYTNAMLMMNINVLNFCTSLLPKILTGILCAFAYGLAHFREQF